MTFIKNEFPNMDADVTGYKRLKEPSLNRLALISIPVGISVAALLFIISQLLTSIDLSINILFLFNDFKRIAFAFFGFIIFNILIIIIHEFLHAIIFPEKLSSDNIIFGVYNKVAFFAFVCSNISA